MSCICERIRELLAAWPVLSAFYTAYCSSLHCVDGPRAFVGTAFSWPIASACFTQFQLTLQPSSRPNLHVRPTRHLFRSACRSLQAQPVQDWLRAACRRAAEGDTLDLPDGLTAADWACVREQASGAAARGMSMVEGSGAGVYAVQWPSWVVGGDCPSKRVQLGRKKPQFCVAILFPLGLSVANKGSLSTKPCL